MCKPIHSCEGRVVVHVDARLLRSDFQTFAIPFPQTIARRAQPEPAAHFPPAPLPKPKGTLKIRDQLARNIRRIGFEVIIALQHRILVELALQVLFQHLGNSAHDNLVAGKL